MGIRLLTGDCRDVLKTLPGESVHCVVTSPPYWGLRDYGVVGQIGLEPMFDQFIAEMVSVFREVRRVLRSDGTLWLNLGDSYAQNSGRKDAEEGREEEFKKRGIDRGYAPGSNFANYGKRVGEARSTAIGGLKPKDLCGIPWRVAQALQVPYYTGRIKQEADRVWLAAMIDAEGCMFIHKRKEGTKHDTYTKKDGSTSEYARSGDMYGAGLEVSNTSQDIVERCLKIAGIGSICEQSEGRRQVLYRWNVRSNECRAILQEIYPYLVAKQHQARLVIGCPNSGTDAEKAHYSVIALHNGETPTIDFKPPALMYEPGWYLRQDIIWSKCNPMPESVTDRCTKAHEYIFLLSKSARYFYDAEAIREPHCEITARAIEKYAGREDIAEARRKGNIGSAPDRKDSGKTLKIDNNAFANPDGRNKRSVWEVATAPFSEAHFATFPPELIEPCIKAGCPKDGTVLDPFGGAGTTGLVADRLQRNAILIELNPQYAAMAERRIQGDAPLFAQVAAE